MPSSKPAIAVRLPQHVFDVFARLAELQGRSKGSVVAEILEASIRTDAHGCAP